MKGATNGLDEHWMLHGWCERGMTGAARWERRGDERRGGEETRNQWCEAGLGWFYDSQGIRKPTGSKIWKYVSTWTAHARFYKIVQLWCMTDVLQYNQVLLGWGSTLHHLCINKETFSSWLLVSVIIHHELRSGWCWRPASTSPLGMSCYWVQTGYILLGFDDKD